MLRKILPVTLFNFFYRPYKRLRLRQAYNFWKLQGAPIPPPHAIKQYHVLKSARKYNIKTFIETGTYKGEMINGVKEFFTEIYTIELDEKLYKDAQEKFINTKHIQIILGDSALMLEDLCLLVKAPVLYWLDGHYSGGITAKGNTITPIMQELKYIAKRTQADIILIDDARLFNGKDEYPDINALLQFIRTNFPNASITIGDDIISIFKL